MTIEEKLERYAALQTELKPVTDKIKALEAEIKDYVKEHGDIESDNARTETIDVKGRVKWDTQALDGYAVANPDVLQFRTIGKDSKRTAIKLL